MRALIVSDIHSNLEALDAVLADARRHGGFDAVWCLGDIVGYGPEPSACLRRLREYDLTAIAGNHDHAAASVIDAADFNGAAYAAICWTAAQLSADEIRYLSQLPTIAQRPPFTLTHGSLRHPLTEYLLHPHQAIATLNLLTTPYCLVGHSHHPFICRENGGSPQFQPFPPDGRTPLDAERRIINPGSVGQPRDGDPRASYALYDSAQPAIEHHRANYNLPAVQTKMRHAKLPQYLIDRLDHGA